MDIAQKNVSVNGNNPSLNEFQFVSGVVLKNIPLDTSYLTSFCGILKVIEIILCMVIICLLGINGSVDFSSLSATTTLLSSWLIAVMYFFRSHHQDLCNKLLIGEFYLLFVSGILHLTCFFRLIALTQILTSVLYNVIVAALVFHVLLSITYFIDTFLHIRVQHEDRNRSIVLLQCHKQPMESNVPKTNIEFQEFMPDGTLDMISS